MRVRRFITATVVLVLALAAVRAPLLVAANTVPPRLSDQEFWRLVTTLSEPDGTFRSDNLLSNEIWFQRALLPLAQTARPGEAYLGVGPEQNFTYILTLKPAIAFIIDIRRGNLDLQLMYKALFELSADRADFVSRLFSRRRPAGLTAMSSPSDIFAAFLNVPATQDLYVQTLAAMRKELMTGHHFALTDDDLKGIEYVFRAFYSMGPQIRYAPYGQAGSTIQPTYAELMAATDDSGVERGFLSSEMAFQRVQDLERRNVIVPVIGNFSGPKAIRAVGQYLKSKNASVSAFYLSNVEEYLFQAGTWNDFCANVATLPLDGSSTFIRSVRTSGGPGDPGDGFVPELRPIVDEVKRCQPVSRP